MGQRALIVDRRGGVRIALLAVLVAVGMLLLVVTPMAGQQTSLSLGPDGAITFSPGLRVQSRYRLSDRDDNHDFYVARVRFKGGGNAFGIATYYTELKLDNVGRFERTVSAQIENAWLNFALRPDFALRIGLYDAVFSRDALTSDSKLLQMDRSLVKDGLTSVGLADNTVGALIHGRPSGGKLEYSAGAFDNLAFDDLGSTGREADGIMVMGRLGYNFFDPAPMGGYADYRASYVGEGRRLTIAGSVAHLSNVQQEGEMFDLNGLGVDLFFGDGPVSVQAEYASYDTDPPTGGQDDEGRGGYAQAGFLLHPRFELTGRFQQFDPSSNTTGDRLRWTSVGANIYIYDHNLKIQSDFTIRKEQGQEIGNNLFQVQLQLDF
jgi:hypothetical protein